MSAPNLYKVSLTENPLRVVNVQNGDKLVCFQFMYGDNFVECRPGTVLTVVINPPLYTELGYTLRNSDGTFEKNYTSKELAAAINCRQLRPTIDTKEKWVAQRSEARVLF